MKKLIHLSSILSPLIIMLIGSSAVLATDIAVSSNSSDGSSPAQTAESPKQEDESIRVNLKSVTDSAHHLEGTLRDIVYEITRQRYVTAAEPNVIGPVVIPAVPLPTGQIALPGYLPPRQKYMSNFAKQTQTLLSMLIEEASVLPNSDTTDSELNSTFSRIKSDLDYLRAQNQSLQTLMAGPSYENLAVGRVIIHMSDKLGEIKKLLKDAEHNVNKDIKHDPE